MAEGSFIRDLPLEASVRQKPEASNELNILIVGRRCVGKSALINSLFFKKGTEYVKIAEEGSLNACTREVKAYTLEMEGVTFHIYDSPGFEDECDNSEYLELKDYPRIQVHLIIYCKKMGDPMRLVDKAALKNITDVFGSSIWESAIIALTFANLVDPPDPESSEVEYFKGLKNINLEEFERVLREMNINKDLKTCIHPVGSAKTLQLPGMGEDWRVGFWRGCLEVCREEGNGIMLKSGQRDFKCILNIRGTITGVILPLGFALTIGRNYGILLGLGAAIAAILILARSKKQQ